MPRSSSPVSRYHRGDRHENLRDERRRRESRSLSRDRKYERRVRDSGRDRARDRDEKRHKHDNHHADRDRRRDRDRDREWRDRERGREREREDRRKGRDRGREKERDDEKYRLKDRHEKTDRRKRRSRSRSASIPSLKEEPKKVDHMESDHEDEQWSKRIEKEFEEKQQELYEDPEVARARQRAARQALIEKLKQEKVNKEDMANGGTPISFANADTPNGIPLHETGRGRSVSHIRSQSVKSEASKSRGKAEYPPAKRSRVGSDNSSDEGMKGTTVTPLRVLDGTPVVPLASGPEVPSSSGPTNGAPPQPLGQNKSVQEVIEAAKKLAAEKLQQAGDEAKQRAMMARMRDHAVDVQRDMEREKEDKDKEDMGGFGEDDDLEEVQKRQRKYEHDLNALAKMTGATGFTGGDWDDKDGYYVASIGELMGPPERPEQYRVTDTSATGTGKGVFATVIKAVDLDDGEFPVAIKIIRNNEMMANAAKKEVQFLERLNQMDPDDKKHIVRLRTTFKYRSHIMLVFEALGHNLRSALKKFGVQAETGKPGDLKRGLNPMAVWSYTRQLLVALDHMQSEKVIHADLKPDNILISSDHNKLKLCDLGSACELHEGHEITQYLVSRFYRAPEIMLGMKYTTAIDMWAAGCTLFELWTGQILFQGKDNNNMLKAIMDVKGKFPHKLIRQGVFASGKQGRHFDDNCDFVWKYFDRVMRREVTKTGVDCSKKEAKDLKKRIMMHTKVPNDSTSRKWFDRKVTQFSDLLEKMLHLTPSKRIDAKEALKHPFVTEHFDQKKALMTRPTAQK